MPNERQSYFYAKSVTMRDIRRASDDTNTAELASSVVALSTVFPANTLKY